MSEVFKLENVELYWPFLYERNQLSNKFQVDLSNLTDDQIAKIEEAGIQFATSKTIAMRLSLVNLPTTRLHHTTRTVM